MGSEPLIIEKKLKERQAHQMLRQLMDTHQLVDFYSNDYLGLARRSSTKVHAEGATGSRLISGNTKRTEEIEKTLAVFYNKEVGLFFNSGYDANLSIYSALPQRGDTVIYDELIHASIRDGISLGNATSFSFKHNDISSLKEKISRAKGTVYVAVESIYSMDGDQSPLVEIAAICEEHEAFLIVDEAHAAGVHGREGRGLVYEHGLDDKVYAKLITFGKAYGSHGALVCGSSNLVNYLINFARPLIYSTALSLHTHERIFEMVKHTTELDSERSHLQQLISFFKKNINHKEYDLIESDTAIQSLVVKSNEAAKALEKQLIDSGFAVKAIMSPTVPKGKERLRFCLHSYNSFEELNALSDVLNG